MLLGVFESFVMAWSHGIEFIVFQHAKCENRPKSVGGERADFAVYSHNIQCISEA